MQGRALLSLVVLLSMAGAGCLEPDAGAPDATADDVGPDRGGGGWMPGAPHAGADDATAADSCVEPMAPGEPSGSAPLLKAWRGTADELAQRLAAALDDPIVGEPYDAHGDRRWNTTSGTMSYWLAAHEARPGSMTWRSDRSLTHLSQDEGVEWLRGVVERFAGAEDAERVDVFAEHPRHEGWSVRFGQHVEQRFVTEAGGYVENMHGIVLYWGPAFNLPERAQVNESRALDVARAHMRCALDAQGKTAAAGYAFEGAEPRATFTVVNESLAFRFLLRYSEPEPHSHCGETWWVHVDALTGAAIGHERPPCM